MRNDQIIHVSVLSDGTLQMRRSTEASRGITDDFVVCRGPRELRNELEDYGHEPHDIDRYLRELEAAKDDVWFDYK